MSLSTVTPAVFYRPINAAQATVAQAYTPGAGSIVASSGAPFGNPSSQSPVRLTAIRASDQARCHYSLTAVAGSTLTIAVIDGYTDITLAVGDFIGQCDSAEMFADIHGSITSTQTALNQHAANAAPLSSPALTGNPTAPTPSTGDSSTSIATTAFVHAQSYDTAAQVASYVAGFGYAVAANNLSDIPSPSTARGNLGLGSAATHAYTDFQPAGSYLTTTGNGSGLTNLNASSIATGTLSASLLPTSGATAGAYTNANVTVDATGRITAVASGTGGGGGGSTSPGGLTGQFQVNSSGAFAGCGVYLISTGIELEAGLTTLTTSSTELILQQTGDQFGTTEMHLQNRSGLNGALFKNITLGLLDFGFLVSNGLQSNIRYEGRGGNWVSPSNSIGEFQFIAVASDGSTYSPGLAVGTNVVTVGGTGSGTRFGVGVASPLGTSHLQSSGPGIVTDIVQLHSGQTVDARQNLASDGSTVISGVEARGHYYLSACTTSTRPTSPRAGLVILDTTLGYPVTYNGSHWVNGVGTTV